jgi:hypothetical protein
MKALRFAIAALLVATACTDSGPKGLDPTVLVRNQQSTYSPVTLTWYDQSGQVQFDSFASGEERCVHFTSTLPTDSVRFVIIVGDTTGAHGGFQTQTSPWFNPITGLGPDPSVYPFGAEYWTLDVNQDGGAAMSAVEGPPC